MNSSSMFGNIMVATDGSEVAKKAVDSAIKIARLNNAKLYAVHVIVPGDVSIALYDPRDIEWKKGMKEHLEEQAREATAYVETAGKIVNVEVESAILEGNPADEIVNFAEKKDIDLIVIGTLGKTGIQRFLLGSVAENVIRHSKKSVLVIRGDTVEKRK
jgi:nucleotide-binding universal stress UspA family protein